MQVLYNTAHFSLNFLVVLHVVVTFEPSRHLAEHFFLYIFRNCNIACVHLFLGNYSHCCILQKWCIVCSRLKHKLCNSLARRPSERLLRRSAMCAGQGSFLTGGRVGSGEAWLALCGGYGQGSFLAARPKFESLCRVKVHSRWLTEVHLC